MYKRRPRKPRKNPSSEHLTPKEREVMLYIQDYLNAPDNIYKSSPTYYDLSEKVGVTIPGATYLVCQLVGKGCLVRTPRRARSIKLTKKGRRLIKKGIEKVMTEVKALACIADYKKVKQRRGRVGLLALAEAMWFLAFLYGTKLKVAERVGLSIEEVKERMGLARQEEKERAWDRAICVLESLDVEGKRRMGYYIEKEG